MSSILEKLTIQSFKDESCTGTEIQTLVVSVNPDAFTQVKETVSFQMIFDATGIVAGSSRDVTVDIIQFKALAYNYNGTIHSPNYVKLTWRKLEFNGRLTSFDVSYTLFKPDGTPLRAKVNASFLINEKTV